MEMFNRAAETVELLDKSVMRRPDEKLTPTLELSFRPTRFGENRSFNTSDELVEAVTQDTRFRTVMERRRHTPRAASLRQMLEFHDSL
ncbi:MAG: hypothetical protein PVJ49_07095, partial [Acidobacteriota bacterium]